MREDLNHWIVAISRRQVGEHGEHEGRGRDDLRRVHTAESEAQSHAQPVQKMQYCCQSRNRPKGWSNHCPPARREEPASKTNRPKREVRRESPGLNRTPSWIRRDRPIIHERES